MWQVENDDYCNRVLEKHWPDTERFLDVKEVHGVMAHAQGESRRDQPKNITDGQRGQSGSEFGSGRIDGRTRSCPYCLPPVDLIAGGFPCQPHSVAGKRRGAEDDRNLWPEYLRIIKEVKPRYVLAENVPGIVTTYIDTVLSDLEGEGYTCTTFNIPAVAFDAQHRRERIFVVAHRLGMGRAPGTGEGIRPEKQKPKGQESQHIREGASEGGDVAYTEGTNDQRHYRRQRKIQSGRKGGAVKRQWTIEPDVGRVAHGVPSRVDRLRGLGNAVVPQVAEWIGQRILAYEYSRTTSSVFFADR